MHVEDTPSIRGTSRASLRPNRYGGAPCSCGPRIWKPKEDPEGGYPKGRIQTSCRVKTQGGWMLVTAGGKYGGDTRGVIKGPTNTQA